MTYFQVFLLWSFFEKKDEVNRKPLSDDDFLSTTIIVPCFNEEKTVEKTILSLLDLDYPKEKLEIMVIDDGSTDNTWEIIQQFKDNPSVTLMQKKNEGSKFAALNFALKYIKSDLVGVLDSDSWVSNNALKEYMYYFRDKEVMATIPSMVIAEPDSFLRKAQKAEYDVNLFARKSFANMDSIFITPGPFSVFRKYVFDTLGPYKEAHHTEDAEIALRMQKNHYKIAYSENSIVYTVGPKTLKPLIKQRVRWVYGFIKNLVDYRGLFFKKEYKDLGMIVLPIGIFGVFITVVFFPLSLFLMFMPIFKFIEKTFLVGYHPEFKLGFDWFYFDISKIGLLSLILFVITIFTIWAGRYLYGDKNKYTIDIIYMLIMYTFIAPLWIIKSTWNAIWSKKESWR
jgi:cellulose synthase/poly-beta-1,6-N-acetylglucosamine synthase-like glycosyltransferase